MTLESGAVASFRTSRAAEVVALLAMQPSGKLDRKRLAAAIWPEHLPSDQFKSLRPALHYARRSLGGVLRVDERTNDVSLHAESGWREAKHLELRIAAEVDPADRLMLSVALLDLIRAPLFDGWDRLWMEPFRQRQLSLLTRLHFGLAEILGARGEDEMALRHIQQARETGPFDQAAVKLQLQLLGRLDRLGEAKQVYRDFKAAVGESGGTELHSDLAVVAAKVLVRGYSEPRTRIASSVQLEFVQDLLEMLAEEAPDRLLPLLAAKQVNWAVVTHGNELKSLLELVLSRTEGWSPDRADVAKRLLQYYAQEGEFQHMRHVASQLRLSPRVIDQVAALNYLAMEATNAGHVGEFRERYAEATALCEREGLTYFGAVCQANRAFSEFAFLNLVTALSLLESVMDGLATMNDANARYSVAHCLAAIIHVCDLRGDAGRAQTAARDWLKLAHLDDAVRQDSAGLAAVSLSCARMGSPDAAAHALDAIDSALKSRQKAKMHSTALIVCATARVLGQESIAQSAARALLAWTYTFRAEPSPLDRRMLTEAGLTTGNDTIESPGSLTKILVDLRDAFELAPSG